MSDAARASIIKQSRRKLMRSLKMLYPIPAEYRTLAFTVPEVDADHLRVDLSYLIDKGYVVWTNETPNTAWPQREYRLTAKGVEVADAIYLDRALEP